MGIFSKKKPKKSPTPTGDKHDDLMGSAAARALREIEAEENEESSEGSEEETSDSEAIPKSKQGWLGKRMTRLTQSIQKTTTQLQLSVSNYSEEKTGEGELDENGEEKPREVRRGSIGNFMRRVSSSGLSGIRALRSTAARTIRKSGLVRQAPDNAPMFDYEAAEMVGTIGTLPYFSIEIYDMDYGKRGDFMGEVRVSASRILEILDTNNMMMPLLIK